MSTLTPPENLAGIDDRALRANHEGGRDLGPAGGAAAGSTGAAPRGRKIKPLLSIRNHFFFGLAVFGCFALMGIPAAIVMGRHVFSTEAAAYVSPTFVKNLKSDQELEIQSNNQYRDYVQQQVRTINRYDIVLEALQRMGDKRWLWQHPKEPDRAAAERLAGALEVRPVPDTYLITVGLEGPKPEGLAEVVNSVLTTYVEIQKKEEFYASDDRLKQLRDERRTTAAEITAKTADRNAVSEEIGVTTFSDSFLNPYDQLLIKSKEALDNARRDRIEAEAELSALDDPARPASGDAAEAYADEMVGKDPGLSSLKSNLNLRRSQLLTKLSGLTKDHPGRPAIEAELADIDAEIKRASDSLRESYRKMLVEQKGARVYSTRRIEQDLNTEVETQTAQARGFAERYQHAIALGQEIDRARKHLNEIDDRIDYLTLESNAPGFVRIASLARPPLSPSKSGHKKTLAMFVVLGLAMGLVAPIAVDFLDPRVHDTNELWKVVGFEPMGSILAKGDSLTREFAGDQLLRLAASLDRERRRHGASEFLLTSSKAGEGTTTAVLDLANALSLMGVRAIAVEANTLKRDERYLGDLDRAGLTAVLDGSALLEEAIQPATGELPDRIAAGASESPKPLGRINRLRAVFNDLTSMYDIVLIDAAPVLLSADTEVLVGMASVTLLVVQASGITKGEIKRAVRTLERLAPPVAGALLTRLSPYQGAGYFGELMQERRLARRLPPSRVFSPWLWR
jgi:polysaccharide biosynthesis transport protein